MFAFSCARKAFEVTSVVFRVALAWGTQDYTKCKSCSLALGPCRVVPKWPERKTGLQSYQFTAHSGLPWLVTSPSLELGNPVWAQSPKIGKSKKVNFAHLSFGLIWEIQWQPKSQKRGRAKKSSWQIPVLL